MLLLHLVAWGVVLAVGVAFIPANLHEGSVFLLKPSLINSDNIALDIQGVETVPPYFLYSYPGWPIPCL